MNNDTATQVIGNIITFYTSDSGRGIPCKVEATEDGSHLIELITRERGVVTSGDLYCEDESGRYLGGPAPFYPSQWSV